jgi:hypothetical protein
MLLVQVIDRNIVFFCLLKKSISKDKFHWGSRGDKQYEYMIVDMNFKIFLTKMFDKKTDQVSQSAFFEDNRTLRNPNSPPALGRQV